MERYNFLTNFYYPIYLQFMCVWKCSRREINIIFTFTLYKQCKFSLLTIFPSFYVPMSYRYDRHTVVYNEGRKFKVTDCTFLANSITGVGVPTNQGQNWETLPTINMNVHCCRGNIYAKYYPIWYILYISTASNRNSMFKIFHVFNLPTTHGATKKSDHL